MTLDILVDGFSHRFGGGVSYLGGLLPPLARHPAVGRVRLMAEHNAALTRMLDGSDVEIEEIRLRPPESLTARAVWEASCLPRRAAGCIVIAPAAMLPRKLPSPVLAVPHNALPFQAGGARNMIQRRAIMRTLGWASGALFVTRHMRRLMERHCALPSVTAVVHHGIGEEFLARDPTGHRREGIVCVADGYAHKRLDMLVEAWRGLGAARPTLRLIGRQMAGAPVSEPGLSVESGLSAGQVADALGSAQLAVLPSATESFGLPALEALACGTPLLASDIPAYREITAGHASLVGGNDVGAWSKALKTALRSPEARETARRWARTFTWTRCAASTAKVLEEVADAHARRDSHRHRRRVASKPAVRRGSA